MRMNRAELTAIDGPRLGKWGQWGHRLVSSLVLLASVAALGLILTDHGRTGRLVPTETSEYPVMPSPIASDLERRAVTDTAVMQAEEDRYRALSEFVARRYRVSQNAAFDLVSHAHRVGRELQLDPLLIIAVIAIESRFNPIAESRAGAKGLMQIIPKFHTDKLKEFGGTEAVFEPETNIHVGARILKEYLRRTGNLGIALQMYAGALGDGEDQYTRKVLNERQRLQQVVSTLPKRPPSAAAVRTASTPVNYPNVLPSALD
ncbi:MAG: lytic transglycosylase domain-containing protein [Burkholderiales bacterium]